MIQKIIWVWIRHVDKSPLYVADASCILLAFDCASDWAAQQQNVSCVAVVATSELQSCRQHVTALLFGIQGCSKVAL